MDRYLVVWLGEGREYVDVIDNAITPHEAANKVREIHVNANVVAVGIMLDNKQWNYLQQLKLRFTRKRVRAKMNQPTLENLVNRLKLDKELLEQYSEDKELLEKRIKQHKEDIANYVTSDRFSYALRVFNL